MSNIDLNDKDEEITKEFAAFIKEKRIEKKISLNSIEKMAGLAKNSLSKIELGKKRVSIVTFNKIIRALNYKIIIVPNTDK